MSESISSSTGPTVLKSSPGITAQPTDATLSLSLLEVDLVTQDVGLRASAIIGRTVVNNADVTVGTIKNLIIDPKENVLLAVLSVGGFLGMGTKHVAVPFGVLDLEDARTVYRNGTKEALESLPDASGATGLRASKLMGAAVVNREGEDVGTVEDLIVTSSGNVLYAVLSVGGFLGIGKKHVAIRYHALQMHNDQVVCQDATQDSLKNLPEFNPIH